MQYSKYPKGCEIFISKARDLSTRARRHNLIYSSDASTESQATFNSTETFLEGVALATKLGGGRAPNVSFGDARKANQPELILGSFDQAVELSNINGGSATGRPQDLAIVGAEVGNCNVRAKKVRIRSSKVLKLSVLSETNFLEISDQSVIGVLDLTQAGPNLDIRLTDATILQLVVDEEFKARDLKVMNTTFVKSASRSQFSGLGSDVTSHLPRLDRQSFAYLYKWATRVGNSEVAHISRACDLGIENTEANWFERQILSLWWLFGNYGLFPWLPLAWIVAITAFLTVFLACQGTVISPMNVHGSWHASFANGEGLDKLEQALFASVNNLISPWSFMSPRRLVVPETPLGFIVMGFHSMLTIVLALLAGFSIRSRFRMN